MTHYEHEEWRDIPGYEGLYRVSSHGRVMSLRRKQPYVMKTYTDGKSYVSVVLQVDNKFKGFKVHILVARAFLGERPEGYTVNHRSGDKTCNHVSNLEWASRRENIRHARYELLRKSGHQKLDPDTVTKIIADRRQRETVEVLAERYNMSVHGIRNICYGYTWKELTNGEDLSDYALGIRWNITIPQIREAISKWNTGRSMNGIAKEIGVSYSTIYSVVHDPRYADLHPAHPTTNGDNQS